MKAERSRSQDRDDRPSRVRSEESEPALAANEIGAIALGRVRELISREPVAATAVEPSDDGWVVDVEVIEERRIPSSSDMLALYEVELDPGGELIAYRRTKRYARGSAINGRNGAS
ncbi:gas vesicle protein [Pseudonocardia sp. DSM 110487]|uniref:gas vesicle protein GvpO n=1 Tax=Pseudonocardia sp. DSM 110487 TaxID=2865833 RepID=UPI001C69DD35|nr:gas vesicle protein GvpO [Pseudonocardia sp. DSM 110487]QYN38092.1 gas vesicle protein [Pseudonocardia sp. DSM 110487]